LSNAQLWDELGVVGPETWEREVQENGLVEYSGRRDAPRWRAGVAALIAVPLGSARRGAGATSGRETG